MRYYAGAWTVNMGVEMKSNIINKKNLFFLLYNVLTTVLLAIGHIFADMNRFITGFAFVFIAIAFYFFIVLIVAEKNWLDIRAVFHGVWVATIGLAVLRLTDYQEEWQIKTWYCVALAYFAFQIGANLGVTVAGGLFGKIKHSKKELRIGRIVFSMRENRLFWICIITTLVGFICFLINVAIRGYIPCFSNDPEAYLKFYTKFHVFAVAATGVSGLCYYCMATQNISKVKKVLLGLCIIYVTFLFPILVVSRGTFVVSALSLTVTVFYLHKKKFLVLVTCLALIAGIYYGASFLRSYTDEQLDYFFEPSEIQLPGTSSDDPTPSGGDKDHSDEPDSDSSSDSPGYDISPDTSFKLPSKLIFIYSYLTVSHDNFNEAVQNSTEYTYGLQQIAPFNSILRSDWIDKQLSKAEYYLVRPYLNTVSLIGYFYYDFHVWGVVIFMLFWSFVFGILQKFAELSKTPFFLLSLGNAMAPVALCFFAAWLSVFSQWLLWGVILIFAVASCVTITPKNNKVNN